MLEETVPPQVDDKIEEVVENSAPEAAEEPVAQEVQQEKTHVPLSALQKERQKRQEAEMELRWIKEQQSQRKTEDVQPEEDKYASATKEDLNKAKREVRREVAEEMWIRNNPERFEKINELLPEFLKRRPNLAAAIDAATNRYEEAWELMDKLSPKEQKQLAKPQQVKREAPGSPAAVSKGAALDQAVDVMSMSDAEFSAWRQSKKKHR